jgi:hypothetical protein
MRNGSHSRKAKKTAKARSQHTTLSATSQSSHVSDIERLGVLLRFLQSLQSQHAHPEIPLDASRF